MFTDNKAIEELSKSKDDETDSYIDMPGDNFYHGTIILSITQFSLEVPKRVIGKHCRPTSDATVCGI